MTDKDFTTGAPPKQSPGAIVIKTPNQTINKVTASIVAFGNNGYVFLDPAHEAYLYGRPAHLAATLRGWADQIDPKPIGVNQ
jgi:hypothetical protein